MPVSGRSGAQNIEVDPVRENAYLKGLAAGRSERAAEVERLREALEEIAAHTVGFEPSWPARRAQEALRDAG